MTATFNQSRLRSYPTRHFARPWIIVSWLIFTTSKQTLSVSSSQRDCQRAVKASLPLADLSAAVHSLQ